MEKKIKTALLGKLRIYITPSDKVQQGKRTMLQKLFPRSAYIHIVQDAKKEGIMNASVYTTHLGFSNYGKIQLHQVEGGNSKLTMCVELVDKRDNLEKFYCKHIDYLKDKTVLFKEVEHWTPAE
jgi:PII-like signaling protein